MTVQLWSWLVWMAWWLSCTVCHHGHFSVEGVSRLQPGKMRRSPMGEVAGRGMALARAMVEEGVMCRRWGERAKAWR